MKDNKTVIVAIAALAIIGIISGTYAYFTSTATTVNDFAANTYETVVERSLSGGITGMDPGDIYNIQNLKVTNQGTTTIAVRAQITEAINGSQNTDLVLTDAKASKTVAGAAGTATDSATAPSGSAWKDTAGETTNAAKNAMLKAIGNNWIYSNGYFYFNATVPANGSTDNLINQLRFNINADSDTQCYYAAAEKVDGKFVADTTKPANEPTSGDAGNIICITNNETANPNSYTGGTYTLTVKFETAQASQALTYWGVDAADLGALGTALTSANTAATKQQ